ncbi:DUF4242 domain-containing protein [Austwickia chelonae]|uniref:DUF4242 domain-containing protein n=1 Tax=Austwickia chelonae TaxID=100225 RepID=UPI000E27FD79|nr:DUF4242 domain-containing protein [Austwickia chelonae]
MSSTLHLVEAVPTHPGRQNALTLIDALSAAIAPSGAEIIEAQVAGDGERVFVIVETTNALDLLAAITAKALPEADEIHEPAPVRLVGADLEEIKATRPPAGYLVEWDLPAGLDMPTYLARKKEKSPKYAEVPEVSFLRTYVREDMEKCLCLYDAPDVDTVIRAREVVSTPIDRLHTLLSLKDVR